LPKPFRFDPATEEVAIRREGEKVILEPLTVEEWPSEFWEAFGDMPDGFDRARRRLADELDEIARHCASLPVLDSRPTDEILGYDEHGLPR
jgi:virulence-associated protein VagC